MYERMLDKQEEPSIESKKSMRTGCRGSFLLVGEVPGLFMC